MSLLCFVSKNRSALLVGVEARCLLDLAYGGDGILDVSGQQERSNVAQRRI